MESEETASKQRQRRRTAAERAQVLEQFNLSGLTRIAFARSHNIALSTLSKWLALAKDESKDVASVRFRELKVPLVSAAAAMQWAVEIVGRDGLVIRCREALPLQDVAWLLRGR
jgi:hypothetical protein